MFGSKQRAKDQADAQNMLKSLAAKDQVKADTAVDTASAPDSITQRLINKATSLDDWETGKSGPIDIRSMPGAGPQIALFEAAKKQSDAGRIGRGLNTVGEGANPNYVAKLDKENELDRNLNASGELESNVEGALGAKDAMLGNLSNVGEARNMNIAGLREGRYGNDMQNYLKMVMRPREPGFLEQLAKASIGGATSYFSGGFARGGG